MQVWVQVGSVVELELPRPEPQAGQGLGAAHLVVFARPLWGLCRSSRIATQVFESFSLLGLVRRLTRLSDTRRDWALYLNDPSPQITAIWPMYKSLSMALEPRSPASHNQMLGCKIRHPSSTNFDEEFKTPIAKRLKRLDSTNSSLSRDGLDEEDDTLKVSPRKPSYREIADSEAESDDEDLLPRASQTELENALPPIKTDKAAIAEYEATRAAENADSLDLQGRLGQRKWLRGKSSIYVDAFNLALETVLEDEAHLFDEAEIAVFEQWRGLSYEGQYL